MALANCSRCSKMFHKSSAGRVCSDCIVLEEEHFIKVRDFLESTPGCSLDEIEAATGVDKGVIMRFLREGRLATLGELASGVRGECKRCGADIEYGRFCRPCVQEMGASLKDSAQELGERAADERHHGLTRRPQSPLDRRVDGR